MCGIAGIITPDPELARRAIRAMNSAQAHRGPDDEGEAFLQVGERWLGLGARRLAIIDRSAAGHQPMLNPETGNCITYNGEIYSLADSSLRRELAELGFRFRGHSDTEALLAFLERFGVGEIGRLDGMFAFAFFDRGAGTVTLARDPAGIKPLYIARTDQDLLFASETRALLATGLVPCRINRAAVASFLAYGAVQEPSTVYEGVRSVQPGTTVTIDVARPERETVDSAWRIPETGLRPSSALPSEIRSTLQAEVERHLISDLPVGVFLSSGFDSTIIAALAARAGGRLRAFTVSFEDNGEETLARETASIIGADHQVVRLSEREVVPWSLAWLDHMDQPSIDGLNSYIVSRAARAAGMVVALSGLGGDELFGGYPSFREVPHLGSRLALAAGLPGPLRLLAARIAATGRHTVATEKARDLAGSDGTLRSVYFHRKRLMSNRQMHALGFGQSVDHLTPDYISPAAVPAIDPDDPIAAVQRLEFSTFMRSMLLRDSDVATMAVSLELRVPMLSRPMLDLMLSVPGATLLPDRGPLKPLARQAFGDILRPTLLEQPKLGFNLPMADWMIGPLRDDCLGALETLRETGVVHPAGIDAVWRSFMAEPETPAWARAWALVALGRFLRR